MHSKKQIGIFGEKIAYNYLQKNNYRIIETNFRCKQGEIDIIAWDNVQEELVFVEVKTRTNYNYGTPAEAIDYKKRNHILKTTQYYLYIKKIEKCSIRFDAVEIVIYNGKIGLNHLKNIDV